MILGGPGAGKSVLAAAMMIQIADRALDQLRSRGTDIDLLPLPIFLRMEDLAAAGTSSRRAETAIDILRQYLPVGPNLASWMERELFSNRATWVLDGLDQVGGAAPIRSADAWLTAIGDADCKAVVTCRTQSFTAQRAPGKKFAQYDLAPFDRAGLRQFIESWFGEKDPRARSLLNALRSSPSLDDSCRTPLVATFACIVHEDERRPLDQATRRTDLYERIIRRIQDDEESVLDDIEKEAEYLSLQRFAWNLFFPGPERNQFAGSELLSAAGHVGSGAAAQWIKRLLDCRLLIKSGVEARDGSPQYSFIHRTILEFLAARHLATVVNERGWQEQSLEVAPKRMFSPLAFVERKSWLPAWAAAVNFLCGALGEKAMLLIETLWHGRNDIAWHRRGLALQCLAEVAPESRKPELVDELCRATLLFLRTWDSWTHTGGSVSQDRPYCLQGYLEWCKALCLLNGRVSPDGRRVLDQLLGELASEDRQAPFRILGAGGFATAYHREYILAVLHSLDHGDIHARALAATTLDVLREASISLADEVLPSLIDICRREDVFLLQCGELHFLWESGMAAEAARSPQIVEELVHYLAAAKDPEVRARVASRIGEMKEAAGRHPIVIPALLLTIRKDPHTEPRIRATWALGYIGEPAARRSEVLNTLQSMLEDTALDRELQTAASGALELLGPHLAAAAPELVASLLERCLTGMPWRLLDVLTKIPTLYTHPDFMRTILRGLSDNTGPSPQCTPKKSAVILLGTFAEFTAASSDLLQRLLQLLRTDADPNVRNRSADTLGELSSSPSRDQIFQELLRTAREDQSRDLREWATKSLIKIGSDRPETLAIVIAMLRNNVRGADKALRDMKEYASRSLTTVITVLACAVESHTRMDNSNNSTSVLCDLIPGIAHHLPEMLPMLKRYFLESKDWFGLGEVMIAEISKGMQPDRELVRLLFEAHRTKEKERSSDGSQALDALIAAGYRIFEGPILDLVHVDTLAELA